MAKISFDYDGTLSTDHGKQLAMAKMKSGNEIWIITARRMGDDQSVFSVAEKLGIEREHIVFTDGRDKWPFVKKYAIAIHYDNNPEQIDKIRKFTVAKGILIKS